ncbi:hypothetical protein [Paenibacillus sp. URB8-2]|uniref:hypothetical protein n=1 Tax=Paenibacillus sp. URB8-2 TaxID=2741301 RepID=UPI0015C1C377|nr:hypothetical protein [Paenibacillus sp. URB8-2]BCG61007.1 hypothetical protein PUR_44320 [Paenibacillus sp. URB8-2]
MNSKISHLLDYGDYYDRIEAALEKEGTDRERIGAQDEEAKTIGRYSIREDAAAYYGAEERLAETRHPAGYVPLFWSFPEGRGARQPWRRKLWEHQRDEL